MIDASYDPVHTLRSSKEKLHAETMLVWALKDNAHINTSIHTCIRIQHTQTIT